VLHNTRLVSELSCEGRPTLNRRKNNKKLLMISLFTPSCSQTGYIQKGTLAPFVPTGRPAASPSLHLPVHTYVPNQISCSQAMDVPVVRSSGCVTVGMVGHPNVGKTSLLNALVGRKVQFYSSLSLYIYISIHIVNPKVCTDKDMICIDIYAYIYGMFGAPKR